VTRGRRRQLRRPRGECLGLVGESGCGKTTVSKMIMRALTPIPARIIVQRPTADRSAGWREGDRS
jgi:ABC-type glutathione transport system ATPase component